MAASEGSFYVKKVIILISFISNFKRSERKISISVFTVSFSLSRSYQQLFSILKLWLSGFRLFLQIKFHLPTEAVVRRCSLIKVFLEISQNWQENTSARDSFLIKLQASACFNISASFTAKFELVFVLTKETLFLRSFILQPTETT